MLALWPVLLSTALAGPFDGSAAEPVSSTPYEQVWRVVGVEVALRKTPGPDDPPANARCSGNGVDLIPMGAVPPEAEPALAAACRRLLFDAPALVRPPRAATPPPAPRVATADPRLRWGLTAALTLLALPFLRRRASSLPALLMHALAMAALATLVAEASVGSFTYSQFTDRDLTRAWRLTDDLPGAGSEMSGDRGARIPGPALGLLFWLGLQLGRGAPPAFALALAGFVLGALALHAVVWRRMGIAAASLTTALWVTHPATLDTLTALWNPTWASPFAGLAVAGLIELLSAERRGGALLWATGLVLGAQVHMSALLWGAANALTLALTDRAALRRGLRALGVVALVAWLPYVIDDAASGWTNTRALLGQATGARTVATGGGSAGHAAKVAALIIGLPVEGQAMRPDQLSAATAGAAVLAAGLGLALITRERVARALVVSLAAVVAAFGLGVFYQVEVRYAAVLAPGAAVASAVGLIQVTRGLPRWLQAPAQVALIGGALGLRGELMHSRWSLSTAPWSWVTLTENLDAITAHTGWTLPEIAGRTAWRRVTADGSAEEWRSRPPIELLLAQSHAVFPGSLPGPCALLVGDAALPAGTELTPDRVRALIWAEAPIVDVQPSIPLRADWSLVVYDLAGARCPTTMSNRYVDTAVEAQLRRVMPELPAGGVQALADGLTAVVLRHHPTDGAGFAWDIALGVVDEPGGVRLESNQLRGYTDNSGWFDPYVLRRPALRYERVDAPADAVEVVWEEGLVGGHFAVTPLSAPPPAIGPGRWRRTFTASVVQLRPLPLPATTGVELAVAIPMDEITSGSPPSP